MANERYNFKYLPLVGKLPGKSMVEQTETAINELASVVYDNVGYVGNLAEEVQTANTNASNALDKATEALETSGRVYIKQIAAVDVNDYYDSELYYINNDGSTNIPVRDRGFLEVKTNDDKTACEQVFIADSTGTPYYRHGVITEQTLGEETTYVVTWGSWYRGATAEYVQEEIRQHGNVPVGFEYFSINPNVPQGSLPLLGGEYERATYKDLWAWVQEQTGYLKTEAEWQALSTANNGNVPYYSSGDGSTTFRVPSLRCWVKGTDGSAQLVGSYLEAGLPDVAGNINTILLNQEGAVSGAFSGYASGNNYANDSNGIYRNGIAYFNASRSNSIYGNSSTVQPESIVGMWLVKAYGTVVNSGSIEVDQYIDEQIERKGKDLLVGSVQAFAGNVLPDGWLLCDGSAISRLDYASLFGVIGTTYGRGDGSTTFNVPNLVDKFIEGSATSGSVKSAGLPNIEGYITANIPYSASGSMGSLSWTAGGGAFYRNDDQTANLRYFTNDGTTTNKYATTTKFDASRSSSVYGNSTTVQPPALTMRYIIKY